MFLFSRFKNLVSALLQNQANFSSTKATIYAQIQILEYLIRKQHKTSKQSAPAVE